MISRRVVVFLGAVMSGTIAWAQPASVTDPLAVAWQHLGDGQDLLAVDGLRALAFDAHGKVADERAVDMWRQFSPRLDGLIAKAPSGDSDNGPPASADEIAAVRGAEQRDAIATITALARDRRVVIVNEAHDAPGDRAFGLAVAQALRPLGFNVLACETFTNRTDAASTDMAALATRRYPVRATGVYMGDPVFGDFVRQSLTFGYRPLAYEETSEQRVPGDPIDTREEAEATNLAAAIGQMPQARFLIYVGYSHATKAPLIDEAGLHNHLWMAGRLKQKTGIDPLTIDQTGLGETNSKLASRTLRDIVQADNPTRSVILFGAGKPLSFGRYRGLIDLQVIHPATHVMHGRPDWLLAIGRHLVPPDPNLIPSSGRVLAQAFLANEGADAIPVDEVILEPGAPRWWMLPDQPVRVLISGSTLVP